MDFISKLVDIFLHIDKYLATIIDKMGLFTYLILFAVIFMETGLVVMPFLPGDSLLFAAGAIAALGNLNIIVLYVCCLLGAFLGDATNYWIGHRIGPKAFQSNSKLLKKEYLDKAQSFYEKHGGKAIVLARFVPIVRTFAPFVAGIGKMDYKRFTFFNLSGGFLWVTIFLLGGFFLGNVPFIKENFHYTVVIIVAISAVPILYEIIKSRIGKKPAKKD